MAKVVKGGTMNVNGFQLVGDGLKAIRNPERESIEECISYGEKFAGLLT